MSRRCAIAGSIIVVFVVTAVLLIPFIAKAIENKKSVGPVNETIVSPETGPTTIAATIDTTTRVVTDLTTIAATNDSTTKVVTDLTTIAATNDTTTRVVTDLPTVNATEAPITEGTIVTDLLTVNATEAPITDGTINATTVNEITPYPG